MTDRFAEIRRLAGTAFYHDDDEIRLLLGRLAACEQECDEHLAHLRSEEDAYCRQRDERKAAEASLAKAEEALRQIAEADEPFATPQAVRRLVDTARAALAGIAETP